MVLCRYLFMKLMVYLEVIFLTPQIHMSRYSLSFSKKGIYSSIEDQPIYNTADVQTYFGC